MNDTVHPTWCYPDRCDIAGVAGAHRSELHHIPTGGGTVAALADLWQSTDSGPWVRVTLSNGHSAVPMLLSVGQANLLGNTLCDLAAAAGSPS